jgi:uncharacterized metal-binding protein
MEENKTGCTCNDKSEKVVMCCSGQSDVGELSDLVARKLKKNNDRKMKCLAQVAINSKTLIENLKSSNLLIVDGCPVDCAKRIAESAGLTGFAYIRITDLGYKKGQTAISEDVVNAVYENAKTYV